MSDAAFFWWTVAFIFGLFIISSFGLFRTRRERLAHWLFFAWVTLYCWSTPFLMGGSSYLEYGLSSARELMDRRLFWFVGAWILALPFVTWPLSFPAGSRQQRIAC